MDQIQLDAVFIEKTLREPLNVSLTKTCNLGQERDMLFCSMQTSTNVEESSSESLSWRCWRSQSIKPYWLEPTSLMEESLWSPALHWSRRLFGSKVPHSNHTGKSRFQGPSSRKYSQESIFWSPRCIWYRALTPVRFINSTLWHFLFQKDSWIQSSITTWNVVLKFHLKTEFSQTIEDYYALIHPG